MISAFQKQAVQSCCGFEAYSCWPTLAAPSPSMQSLTGRTFCRYSRMTDAGKVCCLRSVPIQVEPLRSFRIEPRAEGTRVMQRGKLKPII